MLFCLWYEDFVDMITGRNTSRLRRGKREFEDD